MPLKRCGLFMDQPETLARLYVRHWDWTVIEKRSIEERLDKWSTRVRSKGVYHALSSRFRTLRLPTLRTDLCRV